MITTELSRKEQIIQAAQGLFAERGYAATSMRDLAKAIGIEPASLYSHIKGKEDLLSGICFRIAGEFFEAFEEATGKANGVEDHFRLAIRAHIQVIANNLDATGVFFNEWRHLTGSSLTDFMERRQQYEDLFKTILKQGIEEGHFRQVEVSFTMRLIFSALNGTHKWYKPNGVLSPAEVADNITEFLLKGLKNEK